MLYIREILANTYVVLLYMYNTESRRNTRNANEMYRAKPDESWEFGDSQVLRIIKLIIALIRGTIGKLSGRVLIKLYNIKNLVVRR